MRAFGLTSLRRQAESGGCQNHKGYSALARESEFRSEIASSDKHTIVDI
jgi:hypothetical protein